MRHNENIKKMLAAGLLTLGASTASAQVVLPNSWNSTTNDWNSNTNWLLESGGTFIPNNNASTSFTPEYAVIDNGGTANISSPITEQPLAAILGDAVGMSGNVNMSAGQLTIDGLALTATDLGSIGRLVVGNAGSGTFTQSGGVISTSHGFVMNRLAGSTSTFTMSGGTFNAATVADVGGTTSIGAGGGETAVWNMSGGTFNQLQGEINVGDNNGSNSGIINMTGGTITTSVGDLDIAGLTGAQGVVNMSNNAVMNIGSGTWVGVGTDANTMARFSATDTASLTTVNFLMTQTANSLSTFSGNSSLTVSDTLNLSTGKFRVEGANVNINVANASLKGNYNLQIGAGGHSIINSSGTTILGGTLELDFDGVTPTLGDQWRIVTGSNAATGEFDTITGADLALGTKYATAKDGNNVDVAVEKALTLTYNTASGTTTITDYVGGVEVKGYTVSSDATLDTTAFNSMENAGIGNLEVAHASVNQLSELTSPDKGAATLTPGQVHDLGAVLAALEDSAAFGTKANAQGLNLEYVDGNNMLKQAIVTIEGTENNLVLHVDSATGEITLQNHSTKTVDLKGYTIKSANGDIDVAALTSIADGNADWDEANPTANQFSEIVSPDTDGALTLTPGQKISLGEGLVDNADQTLELELLLADTLESLTGVVLYDEMVASVAGDWDLDGDVDSQDVAIIQNHFGDNATLADLFDARNSISASAIAAIPEPTSMAMLLGALLATTKRKRA